MTTCTKEVADLIAVTPGTRKVYDPETGARLRGEERCCVTLRRLFAAADGHHLLVATQALNKAIATGRLDRDHANPITEARPYRICAVVTYILNNTPEDSQVGYLADDWIPANGHTLAAIAAPSR